jgi:hypothetical protein
MKAQAAVIGAGASLLVSVGLTILIKLFGFWYGCNGYRDV